MDKHQVLIVDDDKDTAAFFNLVLQLVGFECQVVNTGREAIALLAATQPDMVLLDMRLGQEITGKDILYQIRSNPRFEKTRVIITTAYPDKAQPISNLADLILLKPIDMEQLQTLSERLASIHQPKARQFYFRDPVTELFNREFFLIRLEHAFERAKRREDFLFAVLVFAVPIWAPDGEPLDPDVHDHVLSQVCGRLNVAFRPTDTFARLDAERFAGLHEELKRPEDVEVLVKRLCLLVAESVSFGERTFCLQARVGSTLFDRRYSHPEDMLDAAEVVLARQTAISE